MGLTAVLIFSKLIFSKIKGIAVCVCFQMLNNNFGIAPGGQSNKFDAPTIPKYANLILSNLCGCNPPPLYTTPPWLG